MNNERYDIDLWPRPLSKNRLALISAADGPEQWSIGVRDGQTLLNKKGAGDRLSFRHESLPGTRSGWLGRKSELTIRDCTQEKNRLAGLEWEFQEGGKLTASDGRSWILQYHKKKIFKPSPEQPVTSSCFRLSQIDFRSSRITILPEALDLREVVFVAAFEILREELTD
ncbi:MAG: hypothetical protein KDN19_17140 [Verrucomicrobiae bacterium]|nr:hypothetical protein [Verrucomicrobiae bacterium]